MKKQANNKFQGTKFQVIPKHLNTFPYSAPLNIEEVLKMPAYNTHGLEYKRHLPPMRDLTDIDLVKLAPIILPIDPMFNANISLKDGICDLPGWSKFRYKDLFELLRLLRKENRLIASNEQIKEIKVKYYESDRY